MPTKFICTLISFFSTFEKIRRLNAYREARAVSSVQMKIVTFAYLDSERVSVWTSLFWILQLVLESGEPI